MFGRKVQPRTTARTVPTLNPIYYAEIHSALLANGGSDTLADVAAGVANAVFNTAMNYFDKLDDHRAASDFAGRFENSGREDMLSADSMIDFLSAYDAGTQEFITTLLGRLKDVLSKPA